MAEVDEESPAERFDRYLREVERTHEPLPQRLEQSWADRAIMALIMAGSLVYSSARMVGLLP